MLMLATFGIGAASGKTAMQAVHECTRSLPQETALQRAIFVAGIFLPSLSVGAAFGRLVGLLVQAVVTKLGLPVTVSLPGYTVGQKLTTLSQSMTRMPRA